jgi:heptosyltransferase-3
MRHVTLVQGEGSCVPCAQEGCERHIESTSDCLTGLSPSRVIAAIEELLRGPARGDAVASPPHER